MATGGTNYRYYLLPIIGALTFIILSLPLITEIFADWIPYIYYNIFAKALILLVVLFITDRLLYLTNQNWC